MGGPDVPVEAIPLHPVPPGAPPEERDFALLEREILHHIFRMETWRAIFRGLHVYDGQLSLVEPRQTEEWVRSSREYLELLRGVVRANLPRDRQLDLHILQLRLEAGIFWNVDWPTGEFQPFDYLFPIQLTEFVAREYTEPRKRAEAVARQLRATPEYLTTGMSRLRAVLPRPFVTLGLDILKGLPRHFEEGVAFVQRLAPDLLDDARADTERVLGTLEAFGALLEKALSRADESYRLGPERFQRLLWVTDGLSLPWASLLEEGEADLRRNQDRLRRIASAQVPSPSVDALVARLAEDHPTAEQVLAEAKGFVQELRDFVVAKGLASLPDDAPCRVEESPPADRAFAFASMRSAGPFEEGASGAAYRITLPDPTESPERAEQHLRSMNRPVLRNITAHEVYPGHYLQFQHFRRTETSPTRKAFPSGTFSEGWGHYAEQLVIEQGFGAGDVRQEVAQLQDALLYDSRLMASIGMHAQGRSLEEATDLFAREAHIDHLAAEREARRGTLNPSYFVYTLGKLRILEARRAYFERNPRGSLRQFHDRILAHGAPPVGLLGAIALGEGLGPV